MPIVDDPDAPDPAAPKMTCVHWVLLYDLLAGSAALPEGGRPLPARTRDGRNDWQRTGCGGSCPPVRRHRCLCKLYALDATLGELHAATRAAVERAMQGHVLARTQPIGTYRKGKR